MWKVVKLQLKLLFVSLLGFFLLPFMPVPLDFHPVAYNVSLPSYEGPLARNDALDRAKVLFQNKLLGPESFAVKDGFIYTGTQFGDIYRFDPVKETITKVANTGNRCGGLHDEEECGRPLGLRFGPDGFLYTADAYKGLLKIDVKTGAVETLVANGAYVAESKLLFADDLDIDDQGVIYYSQGSLRWGLHQIIYIILEHDTTGRILTYDTKTKKSGVLLTGLAFPNGVQLTKDKSAVLFSELGNKRILRYALKGADKGKVTVFADNLPGGPDNLRLNERGNYWVGIDVSRSARPELMDLVAPYPLLAEAAIRFSWLSGHALEYVNSFVDHPAIRDLSVNLKHAKLLVKTTSSNGIVVELSPTGKILRSLHSSHFTLFSEVLEYKGNLYLGSFIKPYLLRVPVSPK